MLDINNLPPVINMVQYNVTKEQYLEMVKNGEDVSMARKNAIPAPSAKFFPNDVVITYKVEAVVKTIENLNKKTVKYRFNAGKNKEQSPFRQAVAKLDEASFLGWTLYELGFISSSMAVQGLTEIIADKGLLDVTPNMLSTSDDSLSFKMDTVGDMNIGDIVAFDISSPNDNYGIYLGNGRVYMLTEGMSENSDAGFRYLYTVSDEGVPNTPTSLLDSFNGSIYRYEKLSDDIYSDYNKGLGI